MFLLQKCFEGKGVRLQRISHVPDQTKESPFCHVQDGPPKIAKLPYKWRN